MTDMEHVQEVELLRKEIAELRTDLTLANQRVEEVENRNIDLEQKIEYANAGVLVTIPRDLLFAMEARMKELTEEIGRKP